MPIQINGTDLTTQPADHNWMERNEVGVSGDGHSIYSAVREYRMIFNLESASDLSQLITYFNQVSTTGTLTVALPEWNSPTYQYKNYSGCVLREPTFSNYFEEYAQEVSIIVSNIRT